MNRAGLFVALAIAVIAGGLFAIYPQFDIAISRFMFDQVDPGFVPGPAMTILREAARFGVALVAAPAFVAVALKLVAPHRPMLIPGRAAVLMIATLAIGPGLISNVVLKDHWHRPRPVEVTEFGGGAHFVPWWDPRGECAANCSFVAGEPSGAFWTVAAASYAPLPWRPLAYGAAVIFGLAVGFVRMAAGGHFFSDVVFAGVLTFLVVWLAHARLYRWRNRPSDAAIENAIARIVSRRQKDNGRD
jgi:membrane-associated PAP2 superfamily phosphatase